MTRAAYRIIEGDREGKSSGRAFDAAIIVLVILSVSTAILQTEPSLNARYGDLFATIERLTGVAFTVEYLLRLWVCVEDRRKRDRHPIRARLRYAVSPLGIIDLLAGLPFWLSESQMVPSDLVLLMQTLRVLKLLRYSHAFEIFGTVIYNERGALGSAMTILAALVVLISTMAHLAEREAQPDRFGSVPEAMWWGIVTLATVGYGDVVPITPLGRLVGAFAVILGLGMFALPAGIIASAFVEETRRRSFVVTWNLVASVPFFESLPAARIAQIGEMLKPQVAARNEVIIEKGERGDRMYFIISGEADVLVPPRPVRLRTGEFFGEIALLTSAPRTATVVAVTFCQLLVLRVADFQRLMAAHDDLREAISRVASERLSATRSAPAAQETSTPRS